MTTPIYRALKGDDNDRYYRLLRIRNMLMEMLTKTNQAIDMLLEDESKWAAANEEQVLKVINNYRDGSF